jgi:pimeloyl-ACP methyl ester carboxylesterase
MARLVKDYIQRVMFAPPTPLLTYPLGCADHGYDDELARAAFEATGVPCVCSPEERRGTTVAFGAQKNTRAKQYKYWFVYFHGNSENLKLLYKFLCDLAKLFDAKAIAVEYEGYCAYAGGVSEPSEQGCFGNADKLVAYIKKVAPVPVVFFGYSMGCAVALHAAQTHKGEDLPHAMCLLAPFVSAASVRLSSSRSALALSSLWAPFDVFKMKEAALTQGHPLFVAVGKNDDVIPYIHARTVYELAKKHGKAEFVLTNDTHASIRGDPEQVVYSALGAFLKKLRGGA